LAAGNPKEFSVQAVKEEKERGRTHPENLG
jgi:hypothetical protein